ncbi:MAG: ArsR family transcriptional regulator [Solirubrobacteraceae bacterium]
MCSDDMGGDELADRLVDLERRVAALEAHASPHATTLEPEDAGGAAVLDRERFWALAGLQERIGAGSAVLFTGSVTLPGNKAYVWQQGIDAGQLLGADWDQAADALAALGHPIRLKLIHEVLNGASTTAEIGATEGLGTTGQLYHHLRQLVAAGWLSSAGRGRYEVPAGRVVPLLVTIAAAGA